VAITTLRRQRRRRHPSRGSPRALGRSGEWAALLLLLLKGYRLRHRNWSAGTGELDLVMQHRRTVVFVEVKTRSRELYGGAVAAVDDPKRQHMTRTAAIYLSRYSLWEHPCRFDVVTVQGRGTLWSWRVRHRIDAFRPDLGRQL